MPWECPTCQTTQSDDETCVTCAAPKSSWTMAPNQTRAFVLAGKKLELLRGVATTTWPAEAPQHEAELIPATRAPVMSKAAAAQVIARGHWPPPRRLLRVRLFPKSHPDLTVKLTVNFDTLEAAELELPFEGAPTLREDGSVDVLVLLVRGAGAAPELAGVHVVDVSEESARGFAPSVEVAALGKPFKALPTEAAQVYLSARFLDRAGRGPLPGKTLRVDGQEAVTDDEGGVVLEDLPWRDLVVAFDEGEVSVPAVHDPSIFTRVPLRFVDPPEAAPEDAPETQPEHDEEEAERAYPAWLPRPEDPFEDEPVDDHKMTGDWNEDDGLDFDLALEPSSQDDDGEAAAPGDGAAPTFDDFDLVLEPVATEDA